MEILAHDLNVVIKFTGVETKLECAQHCWSFDSVIKTWINLNPVASLEHKKTF